MTYSTSFLPSYLNFLLCPSSPRQHLSIPLLNFISKLYLFLRNLSVRSLSCCWPSSTLSTSLCSPVYLIINLRCLLSSSAISVSLLFSSIFFYSPLALFPLRSTMFCNYYFYFCLPLPYSFHFSSSCCFFFLFLFSLPSCLSTFISLHNLNLFWATLPPPIFQCTLSL